MVFHRDVDDRCSSSSAGKLHWGILDLFCVERCIIELSAFDALSFFNLENSLRAISVRHDLQLGQIHTFFIWQSIHFPHLGQRHWLDPDHVGYLLVLLLNDHSFHHYPRLLQRGKNWFIQQCEGGEQVC